MTWLNKGSVWRRSAAAGIEGEKRVQSRGFAKTRDVRSTSYI
jgi:hypothetical protein